jgi:hypothetical protein
MKEEHLDVVGRDSALIAVVGRDKIAVRPNRGDVVGFADSFPRRPLAVTIGNLDATRWTTT